MSSSQVICDACPVSARKRCENWSSFVHSFCFAATRNLRRNGPSGLVPAYFSIFTYFFDRSLTFVVVGAGVADWLTDVVVDTAADVLSCGFDVVAAGAVLTLCSSTGSVWLATEIRGVARTYDRMGLARQIGSNPGGKCISFPPSWNESAPAPCERG